MTEPIGNRVYVDVVRGARKVERAPIIQIEISYGDLGGDDLTLKKWIAQTRDVISAFPKECLSVIKENTRLFESDGIALMVKYSDGRLFKNQDALQVLKNALMVERQFREEEKFILESRAESKIPFQANQIKPDQFHMRTYEAPFARVDRRSPGYGAVPTEPSYLPSRPVHAVTPRPIQLDIPNPTYKGYIYPGSRIPAQNRGGGSKIL